MEFHNRFITTKGLLRPRIGGFHNKIVGVGLTMLLIPRKCCHVNERVAMTISEKLTRLLRFHNLHAVARAAGIRPETLSSLMKGDRSPHLRTVSEVARVLGVEFSWLAMVFGSGANLRPTMNDYRTTEPMPAGPRSAGWMDRLSVTPPATLDCPPTPSLKS